MAKRFVIPFATSGDKSVTPDATDPGGAISYSQGWPSAYQLPDTDPSYRPVGRQEMNGVLFDVTGALAEIQTLGFPEWVAVAGLVQPYAINATVRHNDVVWRSTIANNSAEPGAVGVTTWLNIYSAASETVAGTAKVALTASLVSGTTDDSTIVTPKKLFTWYTNYAYKAGEALFGIAKIATQVLTDAGVDDLTIVTPKKLRNGFSANLVANGHLTLPSWLGGITFNWGTIASVGPDAVQLVTYSSVFTSIVYTAMACGTRATGITGGNNSFYFAPTSLSQGTVVNDSNNGAAMGAFWFAIGK